MRVSAPRLSVAFWLISDFVYVVLPLSCKLRTIRRLAFSLRKEKLYILMTGWTPGRLIVLQAPEKVLLADKCRPLCVFS